MPQRDKPGFKPIGAPEVINLKHGEYLPEERWMSTAIPYTVAIQEVATIWANMLAGISGVTVEQWSDERMKMVPGMGLALTMVQQAFRLPPETIMQVAVGTVIKRATEAGMPVKDVGLKLQDALVKVIGDDDDAEEVV